MRTNIFPKLLLLISLTFLNFQFAMAQEEEEEEQTEQEKRMEQQEKAMERFANGFEESVVDKEEGDFGDPSEDSIQPAPLNYVAFKKLVDKTVSGLERSLPPGTVTLCKDVRNSLVTSGKIGEASVMNLLSENTLSSVLLSGYAVQANYEDVNAIGCFGSVMNICGHPAKSIPILEYSASVNPNLNTFGNLGDAYRRMGRFGLAQSWLKKAIAIEPYEVDANLLLGQIAMKNGQTRQAVDYFTSSLQGGYTSAAETYLKKLKKDMNEEVDIGEILLKTHKKEPLHEVLKISCPEMPEDVKTIKSIWLPRFENRIASIDKYIGTLEKGVENNSEAMIQDMMKKMNNRQVPASKGLSISCKKSFLIVTTLYRRMTDSMRALETDYVKKIEKLDREREREMEAISKSFDEANEACSNSSDSQKCTEKLMATFCQLATAKLTDYLLTYARTYEDYCSVSFALLTDFYNYGAVWAYTAYMPDQRDFGIQSTIYYPVARLVRDITYHAGDLAKLDVSGWWCAEPNTLPAAVTSIDLSVLPVFPGDNVCTNIQVPLFVGSFQVDCKSWGFEIGVSEFSVGLSRESDSPTDAVESIWPETNRTTLKIGMGLPTNVLGTGFKFDKSVFVTVEDNMTVSDVGMIHETGLTAGGLSVGRQEALKIGTVSGGTFIDSEEGEKKLFAWKDLTK